MQQCLSCGGTYSASSLDGVSYFHACPPLSAPEIRKAIAANASPLTPAQQQQLATLDALPAPVVVPEPFVPPGDLYLAQLGLPRPNARDENIDPAKVAALRDRTTGNLPTTLAPDALAKSPGLGVKTVAVVGV